MWLRPAGGESHLPNLPALLCLCRRVRRRVAVAPRRRWELAALLLPPQPTRERTGTSGIATHAREQASEHTTTRWHTRTRSSRGAATATQQHSY